MDNVKSTDTKKVIYDAYVDSKKEKEKLNSEISQVKKEKEELDNTVLQMKQMMEQMQKQMMQMQEQNTQPQNVVVQQESNKPRSVRLMSLSMGMCYLVDGRFSMKFNKPFDKIPLRETVFEDFFYKYKTWFDELEIIILDDDIAEEYGMKTYYDQYGISESSFHEAMGGSVQNMIAYVDALPPKLQMTFVKEFAAQVKEGSEFVSDITKHYALEDYIKEKFGFSFTIKEVVEQLKF